MNRSTFASLAFVAVCASQVGATDCGEILQDPGFDLWCGDRLCYWKLERGEIDQVPSWHEGDDAVAFLGTDVAISQMTAVSSFDTDCIRFDMLANVEETAEVHLQADVYGDGTIDWDQRIPTSAWDPVSLRIGISGAYDGILFRLTKTGAGDATLARVKAEVVDDEDGGCPSFIDPIAAPLGARCVIDADCADETCVDGACSACRVDADCDGGDVCGREADAPSLLTDWHTCIPAASRDLGELCFEGAECASGACNGLLCGECNGLVACDGGAACAVPQVDVAVDVCGSEARASGEPCVTDAMCASGTCEGDPLGSCDGFGLSPCYEDDDCPTGGNLTPGTCIFVAVAGGSCQ